MSCDHSAVTADALCFCLVGSIHLPSLVPAVTDHVASWLGPHHAELWIFFSSKVPMLLHPRRQR